MAERALVTGGAGFIGSHVVDSLVRDGFEVLVVDDLSAGDAGRLAPEARLAKVDITDGAALAAAFDAFRPQAVFHLAAQASVTASVDDPGRDCAVNVLGTLNVAEAARRHDAPLVFTSTGGALYGDDAPLPTTEDQVPLPLSPYGASKLAAEAYVRSWSAAHGVPNAVMRLGNIYGPRQTPHGEAGVVAIFSYRLWAGEPLHALRPRLADARLRARARRRRRAARRERPSRHLQRRHGRRDRRRHALRAARRGRRVDRRAGARGPAQTVSCAAPAWTPRTRAPSSDGRRESRSPTASPGTYEAMVDGFRTAA